MENTKKMHRTPSRRPFARLVCGAILLAVGPGVALAWGPVSRAGDAQKVVYAHAFDFRGDNERAWQRAADYMVQGIKTRIKPDVQATN